MLDFILGHYAYWFILVLLVIGLYGMLLKKNLVKKVIGMVIFQTAVILFFITGASKWAATVPILDSSHTHGAVESAQYINPLPHTLMLTAIVVGVAISGVAFALIIMIYRRYQTLDEIILLEKMNTDVE